MALACFHCGLPAPSDPELSVVVDDIAQPMCCRGCQAVAQTIIASGLRDYYRYRTSLPQSGRALLPPELETLRLYDRDEVQKSFVTFDRDQREASLILENISCPACLWLNERHLQQLPGVISAQVNYATQRARVRWDESRIKLSEVLREIQKLGYNAHPFNAQARESLRKREQRSDLRRIAVAGICAGQIMMLAVALYAGSAYGMDATTRQLLRWVSAALSLPVLLYAAWPFYRSAWYALCNRRVNMDVPVVIAVVIAFGGSLFNMPVQNGAVYFDTMTMFVLFLLSTRYFERSASDRSVQASENLLQMAPAVATRLLGSGAETVAIGELGHEDVIITAAGDIIAADGIVVEGETEVDESLLTGESRPVVKSIGAAVVAGTMNMVSPIKTRVTAVGEETVLSGVVRLLDRAQAEKPATVILADRAASWFVAGVLGIAFVAAGVWALLAPQRSFDVVLAVLVVTCPCALSLAAPAAFAAAGSRLLKRGILVTRGHALDVLATIDHVIFDKTGTLTHGKPHVLSVECEGIAAEECVRFAAALEQHVNHPFARALGAAVSGQTLPNVSDLSYTPGQGVTGIIAGTRYFFGRLADSQSTPQIDSGNSRVGLYRDDVLLAKIIFSDALRPETTEIIAELRSRHIEITIASGDAKEAVASVAAKLGVRDYRFGLTPQNKLELLRDLQSRGRKVMMVGDGVNDAAILAGADVSIAISNAADIARAASDIILLSDHFKPMIEALETALQMRAIVRQNFAWAILYNLVMLPLAAFGMVAPWLAALGMSTSSFVVVLNALRLR